MQGVSCGPGRSDSLSDTWHVPRTSFRFSPSPPAVLVQSRSFIPSMEKFVDGSNGAQYPTANFLLFADSTSAPRFRTGHNTARGIPCEVEIWHLYMIDGWLRPLGASRQRPAVCNAIGVREVTLSLGAAAASAFVVAAAGVVPSPAGQLHQHQPRCGFLLPHRPVAGGARGLP